MNEDFAHLLPSGELDHKLLGRLLTRELRRRGHSFRRAGKILGLDHHTVKTVSGGGKCSFATGLKICVYLDLNPFELFLNVSREKASSPLLEGAAADG